MAKVFGIGIAESGGGRLAACLRELGYRHAGPDPALMEHVLEAGEVTALDEAALLHDSFAGMPWLLYFRRLDRRFPDARFILEVSSSSRPGPGNLRRLTRRAASAVRGGLNGITGASREGGMDDELVERHERQVQEYFAGRPDKLLVVCWAQERSWRRLCDFLGEPVPRSPLPVGNGRQAPGLAHLGRLRTALQSYAQRLFTTEPYRPGE